MALTAVTSVMQQQDLVKLLAGSAAAFPRGLIVVLQQQNPEPVENQQPLKLAPHIDRIDPPALLLRLRSPESC